MKYFFKCAAIFIALSVLLVIVNELLLETSLPISGSILFGSFAALLLTLLYGWIDAVYIQKRQPDLEE